MRENDHPISFDPHLLGQPHCYWLPVPVLVVFLLLRLFLGLKCPLLHILKAKFVAKEELIPNFNEDVNSPWGKWFGNTLLNFRSNQLRNRRIFLRINDGQLDIWKFLFYFMNELQTFHIVPKHQQTIDFIDIQKLVQLFMLLSWPQWAKHVFREMNIHI